MSQVSFEGMWRNRVIPAAKQPPYVFNSEYYAHRDAARAIGKEVILDEPTRIEWNKFTDEKVKGMSNYAGD